GHRAGPSQRGRPRAPRRRAPPARRQAHAPTPPARDAGVRPRAPRVKSPRAARPQTLGLFEDGRWELLASAQDFDADEVTVTVEIEVDIHLLDAHGCDRLARSNRDEVNHGGVYLAVEGHPDIHA